MTIQIRIEGPMGQQLADSLSLFLSRELQIHAQEINRSKHLADDTKNIDRNLAVLAIVLALPGFANETADLAARLELKQRIEKLIDWVQTEPAPKTKVWIEVDGKPYLPSRDNLEDILQEIKKTK